MRTSWGLVGLLMVGSLQPGFAEPTPRKTCESDTRKLVELEQLSPPRSDKIPKDFKIEPYFGRYVIVTPTQDYNLPYMIPDIAQNHAAFFGANYRDTGQCLAKGPDGARWVVSDLNPRSYIPEQFTMPEKIYNARANAGNKAARACLKEVLKKQKAGLLLVDNVDCLEQAQKAEDEAEKELKNGQR